MVQSRVRRAHGPASKPREEPGPELPDDVDPADGAPLGPYLRKRRAPLTGLRRALPIGGGAWHVNPDEPRVLERWTGFSYEVVGLAPDLASARDW
ncbi:DUF6087 family protein [Streptacidiphilus sp. MAP5-52]|uniref:DUF6087 family protein n=1 Tax=Streptacidiphilus sp. MAP5-52 TaxID=3156267 RepID=UPI0035180A0D